MIKLFRQKHKYLKLKIVVDSNCRKTHDRRLLFQYAYNMYEVEKISTIGYLKSATNVLRYQNNFMAIGLRFIRDEHETVTFSLLSYVISNVYLSTTTDQQPYEWLYEY